MKSCIIFKTFQNEYKIVTQSETIAGYLLSELPVYVLSVECVDEILLATILKALNSSKENIKTPERDELALFQKKMLSDLKEKSFSTLYRNSTSCEIRVEKNIISIYPNKLMTDGRPKDGLIWVKENKIEIEENKSNLNKLVLGVKEVLNRKY